MDESKMTVLTQEDFDDKVWNDHSGVINFENYIVDGITEERAPWFSKFNFINCKIISLCDDLKNMCISNVFNGCEIVDYDKIPHYKVSFDKDCIFVKPHKSACPEEGEFIGWKQCLLKTRIKGGEYIDCCIVKLLIPADAKRSSAFSNKCRCSKAKVLGIYDIYGNELTGVRWVTSIRNMLSVIKYIKGHYVYPDSFDEEWFNECSHGIHFFMTFDEALHYLY